LPQLNPKENAKLAKPMEMPHLRVRIEPKLLAKLEKSREKNGRTLTGEIVARLEESFRTDDRIVKVEELMHQRVEDWKNRHDERLVTVREQRKEAQAAAEKALKDLERQKTEFEEFQRKSEGAIRAAAVVEVLLGANKLKSDLLRSIVLKLADVPDDWIAIHPNSRRLADLLIGDFQQTQAGEEQQ
jgi:Arc-like DNA binding domain